MRPFLSIAWLLATCGAVVYGCGSAPIKTNPDGGGDNDAGTEEDVEVPPDEDADTPPTNPAITSDLKITDIAVFQTVKIDVLKQGVIAAKNATIVVNRPTVFRVYVTPESTWSPHPILGILKISSGGTDSYVKNTQTITGPSTDSKTSSTFNFIVNQQLVQTDTVFSVMLTDSTLAPGTDGTSKFPKDGSDMTLGVKNAGDQLKITILPVHLTNGLVPDTSAATMSSYEAVLALLYPIPKVNITVGTQYNYGGSVPQASGSGWGGLLTAIQNKRQSDGVANDVYYYGLFMPNASFATFCGSGCVAGLSSIAGPNDSWARASIGLGYAGVYATNCGFTMAHEIGHAHGRAHAPCQVSMGLDPGYPYSGGTIGVWGWNSASNQYQDPASVKDYMSYCQPSWISDYNYDALYKRLAYLNGAGYFVSGPATQYQQVVINEDGTFSFGPTVSIRGPLDAEKRTTTYTASDGTKKKVTGYFYPFDHVAGGFLLIPLDPHGILSVTNIAN